MFEKSPIPKWRIQNQSYLLKGNKCTKCNKIFYPKKDLCICNSTDFSPFLLSGNGTLVSFTQITIPPLAFIKDAPYCIGIIKLQEGPQLLAQIADIEFKDLKIGLPVKACFRKYSQADINGIINYGIKFISL